MKKFGLIALLLAGVATLAVMACASVRPAGSPPASTKTRQTAPTTPPAGSVNPTPDQPIFFPPPVGDINPTPTNAAAWDDLRQQIADARAAVEPIIAVFPPNDPKDYQGPSAFYGPHPLVESEKAQVLAIAQSWEPLKRAIAIAGVVDMQVRDYLWKSFSNESAVTVSDKLLAQRSVSQKLLDYLGFNVLPGVFILFHTSHDSYAYAMAKIIVSPATGKVIFCEASVTAAQPPDSGGWDNVNPDSFRLDFYDSIQSPLSPNYDPNSLYGPEGTRFGPPWDHTPNTIGAASPTGGPIPTSIPSYPTASPAPNEPETIFNQFNYHSTSVNVTWYASGQQLRLTRDDPRFAEFIRVFDYSINAPGASRIDKSTDNPPANTVPLALGIRLTFTLLDGSILIFQCAVENVWFETKEFFYVRAFSPELRYFLDDLLFYPAAPPVSQIPIEPASGQSLFQQSNSRAILLKSVSVRPGVLDKDFADIFPPGARFNKGDPCLLVTGQIESQLEQDKYMTMVARGYNAAGEQVAHTLDAGPIYGVISVFLPAQGFNGFVIHLNVASDVVRIELDPSDQLYDIPPP